jgi:hypothetical protein
MNSWSPVSTVEDADLRVKFSPEFLKECGVLE